MFRTATKQEKNGLLTLSEKAYEFTLSLILQQELRPGDWVNRQELAEEMGSSLAPVAEAISRLTHEGYLVTVRRRGTQVRTPKPEEIRDQLILREAIECQAIRMCCGELLSRRRQELESAAHIADSPAEDSASAWQNDLNFHRLLVGASECGALVQCFTQSMQMAMFQHTSLVTPFSVNMGDNHVELLRDLLTATPDSAEARIREHIRTGKEDMFGVVRV